MSSQGEYEGAPGKRPIVVRDEDDGGDFDDDNSSSSNNNNNASDIINNSKRLCVPEVVYVAASRKSVSAVMQKRFNNCIGPEKVDLDALRDLAKRGHDLVNFKPDGLFSNSKIWNPANLEKLQQLGDVYPFASIAPSQSYVHALKTMVIYNRSETFEWISSKVPTSTINEVDDAVLIECLTDCMHKGHLQAADAILKTNKLAVAAALQQKSLGVLVKYGVTKAAVAWLVKNFEATPHTFAEALDIFSGREHLMEPEVVQAIYEESGMTPDQLKASPVLRNVCMHGHVACDLLLWVIKTAKLTRQEVVVLVDEADEVNAKLREEGDYAPLVNPTGYEPGIPKKEHDYASFMRCTEMHPRVRSFIMQLCGYGII